MRPSFIGRHEPWFLGLLGLGMLCLALLLGLTAPLWADEELHTYTLAILHAGNRAEVRWLKTEGECEDLVASQEQNTLSIEGSPVTQVECQCVTFTADGQEAIE